MWCTTIWRTTGLANLVEERRIVGDVVGLFEPLLGDLGEEVAEIIFRRATNQPAIQIRRAYVK